MSENLSRIPKRRFKEFKNADAWEQRKLGDVVDLCGGRDYKHLSNGDIPVYGTGGYMLSVNEALSYDEDAIGIGRNENAVKIEPAHRTSRATALESKSHPEIGWLKPII